MNTRRLEDTDLAEQLRNYVPMRFAMTKVVALFLTIPVMWMVAQFFGGAVVVGVCVSAWLCAAALWIRPRAWWLRNATGYTMTIQKHRLSGTVMFHLDDREVILYPDLPLIALALGGWLNKSIFTHPMSASLTIRWVITEFDITPDRMRDRWVRIRDRDGNIQKLSLVNAFRLLDDIHHGHVASFEDLVYPENAERWFAPNPRARPN